MKNPATGMDIHTVMGMGMGMEMVVMDMAIMKRIIPQKNRKNYFSKNISQKNKLSIKTIVLI